MYIRQQQRKARARLARNGNVCEFVWLGISTKWYRQSALWGGVTFGVILLFPISSILASHSGYGRMPPKDLMQFLVYVMGGVGLLFAFVYSFRLLDEPTYGVIIDVEGKRAAFGIERDGRIDSSFVVELAQVSVVARPVSLHAGFQRSDDLQIVCLCEGTKNSQVPIAIFPIGVDVADWLRKYVPILSSLPLTTKGALQVREVPLSRLLPASFAHTQIARVAWSMFDQRKLGISLEDNK